MNGEPSHRADGTGLSAPTAGQLQQLIKVVGSAHAITDPADQIPYLREWRDKFVGRTPIVLRPGTVGEIAQILKIAHDARIGVVPQGGNTGLVGGQIPSTAGNEIVLSLSRLNRVREVDAAGTYMIVEAGVTLANAQATAERENRLFPLSLPSEGSCEIGGVLATNAGGVGVLAYGNARALALGLEVILADGTVWNGLKTLKKDNTGYDLRDLFIGSEGTLGIITAASLKLYPRPKEKAVAFVALPDAKAVLALFAIAENHAHERLTAFEFMNRLSIDLVLRHIPGTRAPFAAPAPWYALIELSSSSSGGGVLSALEGMLAEASEAGVIGDAVIAGTLAQSHELWRLRETISEAQKPEGGSIKHDISVPVARIPDFLALAAAEVEKTCPGARPVVFGHFGDGNVHYNVSQPLGGDRAVFLAQWNAISAKVHDVVASLGGSISAEHGIGQLKRHELVRFKSPIELDLMRRIKASFDPNGILNPGKLL